MVTSIPALELRASIPYGILGNASWGITQGLMPWFAVTAVCIIFNILLGWLVYMLMTPFFLFLDMFPFFNRYVEPFIKRAQRKIAPYMEKYGSIGLALFIGIPLPGSGVYTGSLGAYVLGLEKRKFMVACVIGVIIAGTLVTALTLTVQHGMRLPFFVDWVVKGK